jgi:hypothetical protein
MAVVIYSDAITDTMLHQLGTIMLVVGLALIVYSWHAEQLQELSKQHRVVYRYVPQEQIEGAFADADLGQFQDMFGQGPPIRAVPP